MGGGSLLVVTGPPGAGKTSVARVLAERLRRSVLVQGDTFFGFLRRDAIQPWLAAAHEQNTVVIEAAACAAGRFAEGGFATVYDGVVGPWFLPRFAAATGLPSLDYVVLLPSLERCIERVRDRPDHGFRDEDATRHMYNEFATAKVESRHIVIDPPERVEEVAQIVLSRIADGDLGYDARD